MAGNAIRTSLFVVPPLRVLDSLGGLVLGAATGAAIVWVAGAVALHTPGQTQLREEVQRSRILGEINERVPPSRLLDAIARVDPFAAIRGPLAQVAPPDPACSRAPASPRPEPSVFRVTGTACGLGIEGSGWVAAPNLVVTNAHVVAGMKDARVDHGDGEYHDATVVAFDPRDDVAVLRVAGLGSRPLRAGRPGPGTGRSRSSATRRTAPSPRRPGGSARRATFSPTTRTGAAPCAAGSRPCAALSGTATQAVPRSTVRVACRRRSSPRASARPPATPSRARSSGEALTTAGRARGVVRPLRPLEHVEDPERLPERRHEVDARGLLARLRDQLPRQLAADLGRVGAGGAEPFLNRAPGRRSREPRCGSAPRAGGSASARRRRAAGSASGRRSARGTRPGTRGRRAPGSSRTARRPRACARSARARGPGRPRTD